MRSPYIGGSLSKPVDRFPDVFGNWDFFKTYPYFLACAVPATFTAFAWLITFLFLKEVSMLYTNFRHCLAEGSHQTLPHRIPLGQLITAKFSKKSAVKSIPPTPVSSRETLENEIIEERGKQDESPLPLRALLVPRVLIAAGNYGAISLLEMAFRSVQPLFFATPTELGGLGLDPPRIGNILSVYGVVNGLFQIFFFADLHDRFGSKAIYSVAITSGIPMILTLPLINALARTQGLSWMVWSLVGVQLATAMVLNLGYCELLSVSHKSSLLIDMSIACVFIYIAAASPNRASLGATNGIAQLFVSIMRAIGPASATSMFSISIKTPEHAWFAYYYLLSLVCVGIGASLLLPRKLWGRSAD
jgi:hypothetical protein